MADLDDQQTYSRLDPSGLRMRLRGLPAQCRNVALAVAELELPQDLRTAPHVVVAGMGGSAIGGDLLVGLASHLTSVPIVVWRDYDLPSFVGENTLVLACSYSGGTEETLSGFQRAISVGAKTIAITSGGALRDEADRKGVPVLGIGFRGEPRSAIGYSFLAPLLLLSKLGLIPDQANRVEAAATQLDGLLLEVGDEVPQPANPAKNLAQDLLGRMPVIFGGGIFTGVARRWKTQINENAKTWAAMELLPEAHHNTVVGLGLPEAARSNTFAILLQPDTLRDRMALRYQITANLLEEAGIPYKVIGNLGGGPLCQILGAVLFGDYTSYYLALLQDIDPSPVKAIDGVRAKLTAT